MNDTEDLDALRRDLALLCCRRRGLDPQHVAEGTSDPLWKSPQIMDTVNLVMSVLGSSDIARRHLVVHSVLID